MDTTERLGFDPKLLKGLRLEHAGVSATKCVIDTGDGEQLGVVSVQDDELVILRPEQIPTAPVLRRRASAVVADRFVSRVLTSGAMFSLLACLATAVVATFHLDETRPGILPPTEPGVVLLKALGAMWASDETFNAGELAHVSEPSTATVPTASTAPLEPVTATEPGDTPTGPIPGSVPTVAAPGAVPPATDTAPTAPADTALTTSVPDADAPVDTTPSTVVDVPAPTAPAPSFPPVAVTPTTEFAPAPQQP